MSSVPERMCEHGEKNKEEEQHKPGLKNMYRTVAVFLCTLNGWPVRMIRFAIIRVVSGFMNVPIATSSGAVRFN